MKSPLELRRDREILFRASRRIGSYEDLLDLQEGLAAAITEAEQMRKARAVAHAKKIRTIADGRVWSLVHPHVIRQVARPNTQPPALSGQGSAFSRVLAIARERLEARGFPILIADLTTVIKAGDLLEVISPDEPLIIEVKSRLPSGRHLLQGRPGRQMSRASSIAQYLQTGQGPIFGENIHMFVMETPHLAQRNWDVLERVIRTAQTEGFSAIDAGEGDLLCAWIRGRDHAFIETAKEWHDAQQHVVFLGTSRRAWDDGLFPPPSIWKIPDELCLAVLEEDVNVGHLVSGRAFEAFGQGRISIVSDNDSRGVHVTLGDQIYQISNRLILDVVYGFETIPSAVEGIFKFVTLLREKYPDGPPDIPMTARIQPPGFHEVDSLAQVVAIVDQPDALADNDLVIADPITAETFSRFGVLATDRAVGGKLVFRGRHLREAIDRLTLKDP